MLYGTLSLAVEYSGRPQVSHHVSSLRAPTVRGRTMSFVQMLLCSLTQLWGALCFY